MGKRGKGAAQRGDSQGYYTHGSGRGGKGRRSEDQVCKYWQEGQCRYGQQCKFRHDDNTYDDYSHKVAYNQQGPNGRKKRVTASAQSPVVIQLHAPSRRSISGPLDPSYKETAVAEIRLQPLTMTKLTHLYNSLDEDGDGCISHNDFEMLEVHEMWPDFRGELDTDGDGIVTMLEFQNGFKRLALSEPAAFMGGCSPELTLMDWLKELERRLNVRVVEQVDHFVELVTKSISEKHAAQAAAAQPPPKVVVQDAAQVDEELALRDVEMDL